MRFMILDFGFGIYCNPTCGLTWLKMKGGVL